MGDVIEKAGDFIKNPSGALAGGLLPGATEASRGITDAMGLSNYSGDKALDAQRNATDSANRTMREIYDQQRADMEPWRQAGTKALGQMQGDFMAGWQQQDPGYQFRMNEGMKAINSAAAARGMAGGGATMKALARYGQDYASNEYDKVYNRNFNRLSTLAGYGTNASNSNVNSAGNYGAQVSANTLGLGNAVASNQIAQTNRMGQLLNTGATAAATYFSDERLKENITYISKEDLKEMKSFLKAYAFNYKNDKHGKGDWIGVMAQDLEKSKLGKTLVIENELGEKMIDANKVLSLFLATMAEG